MKLLTILALLIVSFECNAQTIKQIFQTLPDTILPSLTKNDRLDLIDLFENNMQNEVTNQLKGKSRMTHLTTNLTKIRLSELSEVQFCLLPTTTSYLICFVHSVKTDAWDSSIRFYNPDWTPATNILSLSSIGHTAMTFLHYDFTDDTTLAVSTSELRKADSGKISLTQDGVTTIKWDASQSRFAP